MNEPPLTQLFLIRLGFTNDEATELRETFKVYASKMRANPRVQLKKLARALLTKEAK